ncbi:MAG: nucleoside hydrolase [Oscillospiraceae bacterium]|jgi:inosine-uridine nucleoside N-ribohydrolase
MSDKRKVIIDCDTGSDDTVALITCMLRPEFEILGITTVNGNRCVDYTTENTLRVVEFMGNKYPVYRGCAYPLVSTMLGRRPGYPRRHGTGPANNAGVHGDFIDQLPKASIKEQDTPAAIWLVETLMKQPDHSVTLIPLAPLTNIAHAVAIEPRIVSKVKEVMFMGGGYLIGNKTAVGEMNVWMDPEAAQVVMCAGFEKFTFVPLDATHDAYLTMDDAQRIDDIGTPAAKLVADLTRQRIKGYSTWQKVKEDNAAPVHDPLTVAALCDPTVLIDCVPAHCRIDCGGDAAYGMTIFDMPAVNGRLDALPPNCRVALHADRKKYVDWMVSTLELSRNI